MVTAHEALQQHCRQAHALRTEGRLAQAEAAYRALLRQAPDYQEAAISLAFMLREQGRMQAAAGAITALWSSGVCDRGNGLKALNFLGEIGRLSEARAIADALARQHPEDAAVQAQAGLVAQVNGDFQTARQRLRMAVDRDPANAGAWLRLAHNHRFATEDDPDLRRLLAARARAGVSAAVQISLGFAIGKALDDLGQHARAATAWREANALALRLAPAAPDAPVVVTANWPRLALPDTARAPLFVTGLPRSGTTLLTRQLAAHPQVRDRGELNWLPALVDRLGSHPSPAAMQRARALYLAQLFQDDAPATWYIDKNPLNYRYLDAILRLFPEAKVVHSHRAPRDVALSLWSQYFAHPGMAWSHRFETIAAELQRHKTATAGAETDSTAARWRDIGYRDLVEDQDATVAGLHAWLGLDQPASTAVTSPITTASVWQARQPLYRTSLERWRHYLPHVPELSRFDAVD